MAREFILLGGVTRVTSGIIAGTTLPALTNATFGNMLLERHPNFPQTLGVTGATTSTRPSFYLYPNTWNDNQVPAPLKIFGTNYRNDDDNYFDYGFYYSREGDFGYHSDSFCFNTKTNGWYNGQFPSVKFTWQDESGLHPRAGGIIYANTEFLQRTVRAFPGSPIAVGDHITNAWRVYQAASAGTMGSNRPTHTTGTVAVDGIDWVFVRNAQDDWTAGNFRAFWIFGNREKLPNLPPVTLRAAKAIFDGDLLLGWGTSLLGLNATNDGLVGEMGFTSAGTVLYNANSAGLRSSVSGTKNYIQPVGATFLHSNKVVTTGTVVDTSNASLIRLNYAAATTITSFSEMIQWQEFAVHSATANATLANNANIILKGGANRTLAVNEVIKFLAVSATVAAEI